MNTMFQGLCASTLLAALASGCGSNSGGSNLPMVTPPVKAAAPTGLNGNATSSLQKLFDLLKIESALATAIDPVDFKSRFFSSSGPTQILSVILPAPWFFSNSLCVCK